MSEIGDAGRPARRFVVVWRAAAAVNVPYKAPMTVELVDGNDRSRIVLETYYQLGESGQKIPRDLYASVTVSAGAMQSAMEKAHQLATMAFSILAVVNNAAIEEPYLHLAMELSDSAAGCEYVERLSWDEVGLPHFTRRALRDSFEIFWTPFSLLPRDQANRFGMALAHYNVALRQALRGREVPVVASLWMAVEAITPLARQVEIARAGSKENLRQEWGLEPPRCAHCDEPYRKAGELDPEVRRRVIFRGDDALYTAVKKASDKFEHAGLSFDEIHTEAERHCYAFAATVRSWLIHHLVQDPDVLGRALGPDRADPIACVKSEVHIRSTLLGDVTAPAPDGWPYPHYRLRPGIALALENADGTMLYVLGGDSPQLIASSGVQERDTHVDTGLRPPFLKPSS